MGNSCSGDVEILESPQSVQVKTISDNACLDYKLKHGAYKGLTVGRLLECESGIDYLINLKNNEETSDFVRMVISRSAKARHKKLNELIV